VNRSRQFERGFTLIEMLVAMVIFASLIAVLMMGFRQGLLMWEKGQGHAHVWQDHEFRYRLMDSLVTAAVISDNQTRSGLALPWFEGSATSMRFISAAPMMDLQGRARPIEIQATRSNKTAVKDVWALRYREGKRHSDSARGLRWSDQWVTLYDDLQSISFSFEAPVYPLPPFYRNMVLSADVRLRYRDKAVWMSQYDISALWVPPQAITIAFVDHQGIEHRWLFSLPDWAEAWSLGSYAGGLQGE